LYLLQGIDGRYIRFAVRPPKEKNPYLSERGKKGDGLGFALGKEGVPEQEEGEEGEIVGIDIIADEAKVSVIFGTDLGFWRL
jgi:gamma-tubulin complex component 3